MAKLSTILGHPFKDPALLEQALTHPSLGYESQCHLPDNQRLEFLGDAVIQLLLSEFLFKRFPEADEGQLTKIRAQLVSTKALARIARSIDLGRHLRMSRGEDHHGGRERDSCLADAMEAVVGAVYLDGGMDVARSLAQRLFLPAIDSLGEVPTDQNPKGQLQEILQASGAESPKYKIVDQSGPDHEKRFVAVVTWQGMELGKGQGKSKKEAEVEAARAALEAGVQESVISRTSTPDCEHHGKKSPQT
jgi:ribonuclease-3